METETIGLSLNEQIDDVDNSTEGIDDGYNLLVRPHSSTEPMDSFSKSSMKLNDKLSENDEYSDIDSSETSDSDNTLNYTKKYDRTKKCKGNKNRLEHFKQIRNDRDSRFRKYNIWTSEVQEQSLMENLRECDVTNNTRKYSRNVESYDYTLKYRMDSENRLKRRQSHSDDDSIESNAKNFKRFRYNNSRNEKKFEENPRKTIIRHILDLSTTEENDNEEIASDIAIKLCEEKDDLILRVIEIIGKRIPIELFKETQNIEKEGGLMIMNGSRRRTPGGVFFYLLKNHSDISQSDIKLIFSEDSAKVTKEKKIQQSKKRERKVEELKQSLKKDKDLPKNRRPTGKNAVELKPEQYNSISNPPPSPVTDGNRENSSDYDTNVKIVNNINNKSLEKDDSPNDSRTQNDDVINYNDDFLDYNCDEMELF